jgi:hypothetical protein
MVGNDAENMLKTLAEVDGEQPLVDSGRAEVVKDGSLLNRELVYPNLAYHSGSRVVSQSIGRVIVGDYHKVVGVSWCKGEAHQSATSIEVRPGLYLMLRWVRS